MNEEQVKKMEEWFKQLKESEKKELDETVGNFERKLELYEKAREGGMPKYFLALDLVLSQLESSRKIPLEFHEKMLEAEQKITEANKILEKKLERKGE